MQIYANNEQPMQKSPSLLGVIKTKIVGHVQNHKASQLFKQAVELAAGVFLGALFIAPAEIMAGAEFLLKTNDYALPKMVGVMTVFFGRKSIIRTIKGMSKYFERKKAVKNQEKLIDDIPVAELVDYMLRNKHFKREGMNGVRATFGLNMEKFNRLAKKLEENKVLVRGENNGRIVAGHWSRQALVDYLSGEEKSVDLLPRFTIHRIGGGKVRLMKDQFEPALQD